MSSMTDVNMRNSSRYCNTIAFAVNSAGSQRRLNLRRGPVHRLGHVRRNPARLAGFDVVDFVVPLVGHGVDLVDREVSRAATAKVPPICVSIGRTMLHIGRTQRARSELATP